MSDVVWIALIGGVALVVVVALLLNRRVKLWWKGRGGIETGQEGGAAGRVIRAKDGSKVERVKIEGEHSTEVTAEKKSHVADIDVKT